MTVDEAVANFLTVTLPVGGPSAAQVVNGAPHGVYLRDLSPLSSLYRGGSVRVAVKDAAGNARITAAFHAALDALRPRPTASATRTRSVAVSRSTL